MDYICMYTFMYVWMDIFIGGRAKRASHSQASSIENHYIYYVCHIAFLTFSAGILS